MQDESHILWTAGFLNERFPAPVSPLGWSVVGPLFDEYALRDPLRFMGYPGAAQIRATRLVRGHPYANVLIFQILYNPFPDTFLPADAVRYFPDGAVGMRANAPYPRSILNPRFLTSMLLHALRDPINWSPFNCWQWKRYTRLHDKRVASLNARLDRASGSREILSVIAGANEAHADFLKIHRWSLTYADLFFKFMTGTGGETAWSLIAEAPNMTQQVDQDAERLGALAGRLHLSLDSDEAIDKALADPEFERAVQKFIAAHGHRSFSLDIAAPTFRDDPCQFLRLLQTRGRPLGEWQVRNSRAAIANMHLPLPQRALLNTLLPFARRYASLREDQRYYWQKSLAVTRRAYVMLGAELVRRQVLDAQEDIFYATDDQIDAYFQETLAGAQLAMNVRDRRGEWKQYWSEYILSPAQSYPAFLQGDAPLASATYPRHDEWRGRGISPGQARGRVRVILNGRDLARVATGEILVAPATDPGWTPVFSRLSGLVVERGGVLAHSAIVAREHRVPAVAGLSNITQELTDGDMVEVDGTRGLVRRITEE